MVQKGDPRLRELAPAANFLTIPIEGSKVPFEINQEEPLRGYWFGQILYLKSDKKAMMSSQK